MQDFTQLKVWRSLEAADIAKQWRIAPAIAHNFTVNLYKITSSFPDQEKFGLTNRLPTAIRRSTNGGALQRTGVQALVSSLTSAKAAGGTETSGGQHSGETPELRPQNLVVF